MAMKSLAALPVALAAPLPAQTPAAPAAQPTADPGRAGRATYDAAFFSAFAPSNALQMIERVPGFSLDTGDQNVRGFSQAAGNVVIDGQRPSSKTDTLDTILARIPASRVVRIEVAPGDQFGSEYSGKAQVANVVLDAAGGLSGTVEGSVSRSFNGRVFPEGSGSVVLKRGASSFTLGASLQQYAVPERGFDRITSLTTGQQTEFRSKYNDTRNPHATASLAWQHNGGVNRTAHLNGQYTWDWFRLTQYNDVTPALGAIRDDRLFQTYDFRSYEIGGDVTRPFAGGGLKLVGLVTRRERNNLDTSLNRVQSVVTGGFEQALDDRREETLARVVWSRSGWNSWNVELGAEGALNRLVSDVNLAALGAGGGRVPINLPIDHAIVEEYRGEAFVNAGRPIAKGLRFDAGLTYEASKLTVSGDATAQRTLNFLKPKLALDWQLPDVHVQLSIARTVAQLQFEDFISVAELTNDRVNGGNAGLLPQRAWELRATLDRPILGDGLAKLELGYDRISLLQDRVPTPDGFDAPGNLGTARALIWRGTLDLPLAKLGIKGGRLKLYGSIVDGQVRDPYTGRDRAFSGNSLSYWYADFRQDLGKFAWGLYLEGASPGTGFRRDELDTFYGSMPFARLFAEYRPTSRTSFTLGVRNAFDLPASRERIFFTPTRANAVPVALETRERNSHVRPYLAIKHSFG